MAVHNTYLTRKFETNLKTGGRVTRTSFADNFDFRKPTSNGPRQTEAPKLLE